MVSDDAHTTCDSRYRFGGRLGTGATERAHIFELVFDWCLEHLSSSSQVMSFECLPTVEKSGDLWRTPVEQLLMDNHMVLGVAGDVARPSCSIHLGLTASSTNYQVPGGQCSGAPRYLTAEKPPVEPP
jgi:hypothetical protein